MKGLISSLAIVAIVGMAVAGISQAYDEKSVTATVSVQYSAVSLNHPSFNYGSIPANNSSTTLTLWLGAGITATNDGSNSDFDIYGADSTGSSGGWDLSNANNTGNNYMHKFCNTDSSCASYPADYTAMSAGTVLLEADVDNAEGVTFQLGITTPTVPTDLSTQEAVVTIQASAN